MDIDTIQNNYKFLIIDTNKDKDHFHILKSDRQVSVLIQDTYDIKLSHMYIRRNLIEKTYILVNNILIKKIWG